MIEAFKEALQLCKTIIRNGHEAYVVNAALQHHTLEGQEAVSIDIATDLSVDDLIKLFPEAHTTDDLSISTVLEVEGILYRFYKSDVLDGAHPETMVARITSRLLRLMDDDKDTPLNLFCSFLPKTESGGDWFHDISAGVIRFKGLPDETLKQNYLLGVQALRYSANYNLPIEENTWMAIVRNAYRIMDYLSVTDIMDEWRKVESENLWLFTKLFCDAQLMHGLMPEVLALSGVVHTRTEDGEASDVLAHTIETMRRYPEELPYDWYGVMACLFHDIGKLFTAEYFDDKWTFYQHEPVGAKVTRRILKRLRFDPEDIDLICHLVRNHGKFLVMLTDRGLRRFMALEEYPRLIEMARAGIKASDGNYAAFNHNLKTLQRLEQGGEVAPEPLLNGNEIMDFAGINRGPSVGIIRKALLQAQISGDVTSIPEAVEFVSRYRDKHKLS